MTRSLPLHAPWALSLAASALLVACAGTSKGTTATTTTTPTTAIVRPNTMERDNERRGTAPHVDSLGGPFGNGNIGHIVINRPTPSPSARIDSTTTDSALVSYLNSLVYESGRDRSELALVHCRAGHPMCAPNVGVPMYIHAESGMDDVSAASIPPQGVIVARMINFDPSRPGGSMGVPPLSRAWWYVYREPSGLKSIYFARTHSTTGSAITVLGAPRDFYECPPHAINMGQQARAKWASCSTVLAAGHGAESPEWTMVPRDPLFVPATFKPTRNPRPGIAIAADTWVSCMATCCSG
jgi:hypothetical protein